MTFSTSMPLQHDCSNKYYLFIALYMLACFMSTAADACEDGHAMCPYLSKCISFIHYCDTATYCGVKPDKYDVCSKLIKLDQ
jgi:hypothetical protein